MSQKKTGWRDVAYTGAIFAAASFTGTAVYELGRTIYANRKKKKNRTEKSKGKKRLRAA